MSASGGNIASETGKDALMLEFYVESPFKMKNLRDGPFVQVLEPLADWLHEQGYAKLTGVRWFRHVCEFNRWFNENGYRGQPVDYAHIRRYFDEPKDIEQGRSGPPKGKNGRVTVFPQLIRLMREWGLLPPEDPTEPAATLIKDYERHPAEWYGNATRSIIRHRRMAEKIHAFAFGSPAAPWQPIENSVILDFVKQGISEAPTRPADTIGGVRKYLRYLQLRGHDVTSLLAAVPCFRRDRRPLPERVMSKQDVKAWLSGFERTTPEGMRDYAIALCLADMGLRAGDTATLSLDDIDWRKGAIRVPNVKTGQSYWLPLPARTGKAIAKYLRRGRPENDSRQIFVRHRTPLGVPLSSTMIQRAMKKVAKRQGVTWFGTHALRHTAATRMRTAGASLKEISDVLGHVDLNSTAIYAKVDLGELAEIAQPWPEGQA